MPAEIVDLDKYRKQKKRDQDNAPIVKDGSPEEELQDDDGPSHGSNHGDETA